MYIYILIHIHINTYIYKYIYVYISIHHICHPLLMAKAFSCLLRCLLFFFADLETKLYKSLYKSYTKVYRQNRITKILFSVTLKRKRIALRCIFHIRKYTYMYVTYYLCPATTISFFIYAGAIQNNMSPVHYEC